MDGLQSSPCTNGVQACLPRCWHQRLPWVHAPTPLFSSWANASETAQATLGTVTHLQLRSDLPGTVALPTPIFPRCLALFHDRDLLRMSGALGCSLAFTAGTKSTATWAGWGLAGAAACPAAPTTQLGAEPSALPAPRSLAGQGSPSPEGRPPAQSCAAGSRLLRVLCSRVGRPAGRPSVRGRLSGDPRWGRRDCLLRPGPQPKEATL